MSNYTNIRCQSRIENEVMIRCMVGLFIAEINPTLDELTEVKTMTTEAVVNAIIHGYEGKDDGEIRVQLRLEDRTLMIVVEDDGCGISDLVQARQPLYTTKPELERSGMGITIMESLADSFDIISQYGKGTIVKMTKQFRGQQ